MVQVVGPPTSAHSSEGAYCIPVRVQGSEHQTLLDSGVMQSLIRQPGSTRGFGDGSLDDNQVHPWR